MSWKRRTRAVTCGALLVVAGLVMMPSTSGALMIKWHFPPQVGDPDVPGNGTTLIKLRGGSVMFGRYSTLGWCLIPTSASRVRSAPRQATPGGK